MKQKDGSLTSPKEAVVPSPLLKQKKGQPETG